MTVETIEQRFKDKVCNAIRLQSEGVDRFRVLTPFLFEDGDHFAIVLKRANGGWRLSDEGHTFMHLTYDIDEKDLGRGGRAKIISNALSQFSVEERAGELTLDVPDEAYGDALYSFIQAIDKITDVTYLTRERVKSMFMEDFRAFIAEIVPEGRRTFDWHDPVADPDRNYVVDCRINGMPRPWHLFALPGDDRVRDATIVLLHLQQNSDRPLRSLAIFEDQVQTGRKVLARFSDVCDKQFSSLASNRSQIEAYLQDILES